MDRDNISQHQPKISSVLQLSKYKVGEELYFVILRSNLGDYANSEQAEEWMTLDHPKVYFDRKVAKQPAWMKLPMLHALDFKQVTDLLTAKIVVEPFVITNVYRNPNTGEFYYSNHDDETMPERFLFKSRGLAGRERSRIVKMVKHWVSLADGL